MKKILILVLIAALAFGAVGCGKGEDVNVSAEEDSYTAVEIETLAPQEMYIENIMTAKVYADKDVYVIPALTAKVQKIYVSVGDRVQKDQTLFTLDGEDIDKQVKSAMAAYESAKASYDVSVNQIQTAKENFARVEALYNEGAIAESEYDQAKLAASDAPLEAAAKSVDQARIAYENAASAAKNTQVKAPISGVIASVNVEEGEYASSSQPPMSIVDSDSVTVKLGVPSNMVNKIKVGDKVKVEISSAGLETESVIQNISTSSDVATNLYTADIVLQNDGTIKPGMFAKVYFFTDRIENALAIKAEAVLDRNDSQYVFIADGEKAVEREITTGLDTGEYVEVKSGLTAGDKVIISGQDYVNDGSRIKVVRGE